MNRLALTLLILFSALASALAQTPGRPALSNEEREKWLCEMRAAKHDHITRQLSLSKEQQDKFFPVYDEMDAQLAKIAFDTREMERKADSDPNASDEQLEAAAKALYAQKSKEGQIKAKYFEQFKQILTPRQLLRLKRAERDFTTNLVRHHAGKKDHNTQGKKEKPKK